MSVFRLDYKLVLFIDRSHLTNTPSSSAHDDQRHRRNSQQLHNIEVNTDKSHEETKKYNDFEDNDNIDDIDPPDVSIYNLCTVCIFCAQFVDPDYVDGVAPPLFQPQMV